VTDRPLVSVVTATRDRHAEVRACIDQVRSQTYRPIEHVIVADGPDPALRELLYYEYAVGMGGPADADWAGPDGVHLAFVETGRCWSAEWANSPAAAPFLVAQLLARGELQMWLSDDEEMDPRHVETLVDAVLGQDVDFAYSLTEWWVPDRPELTRVIGTIPPRPDQLTNVLYRTALLDYGRFEPHVGRGTDWHQVAAWLAAGASYALVKQITFRHRADQLGGVAPVAYRQPLRGLGGRGTYAGPLWRGAVPLDASTGRPVPGLGVTP
jgi:hypothetical protein